MIYLWVNKRNWRHPGPIINVALHNTASLSMIGLESHLCLGQGMPSDTTFDLQSFYHLDTNEKLFIHRVPRWQIGSWSNSLPIIFHACRLAKQLALRDRVAVITRDVGFLPFLVGISDHKNIFTFYETHDFFADLSWRTNRISLQDKKQRFIERHVLPRISGLICLTSSQQELYQKLFPELPSCVLPLGTKPFEMPHLENRRKQKTLVYIGHLHASKGINFLLKSAAQLSKEGIRTRFIGGSSGQIQRFKQTATKIDGGDKIEFSEFISPQQLHQILSNEVSIGIVPLQDTFYNRYLTCPAKALDYLSHSLPIIATDLPSIRDVVDQAAILIQPRAGGWFRHYVRRLLNEPDLYAASSYTSFARALELSWENRAKKLATFVETVCYQ